jgi:hypothetical protein
LNYVVIEIQTDANEHTATLVTVYDNLAQAESKYYTILAAAALSNLFIHSAVIVTADGSPYMHYSYRRDEIYNAAHPSEPEPEETIEPVEGE